MVEQYESQDALLAHFGMVVTHTVPGSVGDNPWVGKSLYEAFAMSVHFKDAAGDVAPLDSSQPKIAMYYKDAYDKSKISGGELGSFFSYQAIDECPEVGDAATVVGYTPPAGATTAGWQAPEDIIDDSLTRAFKDVTTWTSVMTPRVAAAAAACNYRNSAFGALLKPIIDPMCAEVTAVGWTLAEEYKAHDPNLADKDNADLYRSGGDCLLAMCTPLPAPTC